MDLRAVPAGRARSPRQPRLPRGRDPALGQGEGDATFSSSLQRAREAKNVLTALCWGRRKETTALFFKVLAAAQRQAPSFSVLLSGCCPRPLFIHGSIMLSRRAISNIPDTPQCLKSSGPYGMEPHTPVPPLLECDSTFELEHAS